jgi:hypothetical protein
MSFAAAAAATTRYGGAPLPPPPLQRGLEQLEALRAGEVTPNALSNP